MSDDSTYSYSAARANLKKICDEVADNNQVAYIYRRGAAPVALISASELDGLRETAHLLRSPKNAERLLAALHRGGRKKVITLPSLRKAVGLDE